MRSSTLLVAAVVAGVLAPSLVHAFSDATQFFNQPKNPHAATFGASGEGLYFTGAPRWASRDCSTCHEGGPGAVGLSLNADDQSLFTDGYVPGKTYELQVEITNETAGLMYNTPTCTDPPAPGDMYTYVQCNNNNFGLEVDDVNGPLTYPGEYCAEQPGAMGCPMPDVTVDQTVVAPDGDAIFGEKVYSSDPNNPKLVTHNDPRAWRFWWTAPKAGTGPITVYVGAVDGNGGSGTPDNDQDPYGDDAVSGQFFLQESGAPVNNGAHACGAVPGRAPAPWWLALFLVAVAGWRQSRRVKARATSTSATTSKSAPGGTSAMAKPGSPA